MVQQVFRGPALLARPGTLLFLTVTAPGERAHFQGRRLCPCTPEGGVDVGWWNATSGERWNRFLEDLRRSGLLGAFEYAKVAEVQKRGALHFHAMLRVRDPLLVTRAVRARVRQLAIRYGFGHELDLVVAGDRTRSAQLLAWYMSKYVAKSADSRPEVPWVREVVGWVIADDGEWQDVRGGPKSYRTYTTSRNWGCSMAAVRAARWGWWTGSTGGVVLSPGVDLGTFFPIARQSPDWTAAGPGQAGSTPALHGP